MKKVYISIFITVLALGVAISLIQKSLNGQQEREQEELKSIIDELGLDKIGEKQNQGSQKVEFSAEILTEGSGPEAEAGDTVIVHYTGSLLDGTVFDSSVSRGEPFSFILGEGRVIAGWEKGLLGAKKGERLRLVVPPELGYGETGIPNGPIPPNAALIFEVEVLDIQKHLTQ